MKKKILALILACSLAATGSAVLQPANVYAGMVDSPSFVDDHLTYAKSRSVTAEICYGNELGASLKTTGEEVTLTIKPKNGKKTKLGLIYVDPETEKQKVVVKAKKRSKLTYTFKPENKFIYFNVISNGKIKKVKATLKSKKAIIGNDFTIG